MIKSTFHLLYIWWFFISLLGEVLATTIIIQTPEDVFKGAEFIIEGQVQDIVFIVNDSSSSGYADVTVAISAVLKGDISGEIIIRRYGARSNNNYLFANYTPIYSQGDRIIVAIRKHETGYYKPLGLYNGTFYIISGYIKNSDVPVERFKAWIRELMGGIRNHLPTDIPRFEVEDLVSNDISLSNGGKGTLPKTMSSGSHLAGKFVSFNETWNSSYLPVRFYYNSSYSPASNSTVIARTNDAFGIWNALSYSALSFSSMSTSYLTSDRQVDNTKSVILWQDWTNGVLAQEFPYPEENGPRTKKGSDIIFNTDYNSVWYFGSSPPPRLVILHKLILRMS